MLNRDYIVMLSKRETDINEHLLTLYNLVLELKAKVVVELGAGQSTFALCAGVNATEGHLFSIDKVADAHLRLFPGGEGILEPEPRRHFIQGDDVAIAMMWNEGIDFLFIDTSHEREHTKKELEEWGKWVKVGGKIALHDTFHKVGHAVGCRVGVDEFIGENLGMYSVVHHEFKGGLSILTKLNAKKTD